MTVDELLSVTSESADVCIVDTDGNNLALYDGRNSIPVRYNSREIISLWCDRDSRLCLEIQE